MTKIKVAVIGAGHLGKIHARLLPQIDNVELVAVADPSPLAQKAILEQMDVQVISDYRKLLGSIDAAVVATPTRTHFPVAVDLLHHSIHTLIEKPVTDDSDDARELVHLAEQNGCVLSVGHVEQFNPGIKLATDRVGTPKFIQAIRTSGYTYRSIDIGVVHDLMIHDIDLANSLFPGELVDCQAIGISVFGANEDMAQARLKFSCGGVANLTASRASFESRREFQVFGSAGYASVDLTTRQVTSVSVPSWVANREFDFLNVSDDQRDFVRENLFEQVLPKSEIVAESANAILCEQQDWIDSILYETPVRNSGENAAEAVEIAAQVLAQIDQHGWSHSDSSLQGALATPNELATNDPIPAILGGENRRAA